MTTVDSRPAAVVKAMDAVARLDGHAAKAALGILATRDPALAAELAGQVTRLERAEELRQYAEYAQAEVERLRGDGDLLPLTWQEFDYELRYSADPQQAAIDQAEEAWATAKREYEQELQGEGS